MPKKCEPGDLVVMYVTRRAFKSAGFFGIFSIESKDPNKDSECKSFGTLTKKADCSSYVELKPIQLLEKPIGIEIIKSSNILYQSNFGKKNMLGTYFQASKNEFDELLRLTGFSQN